MAGFPSGGGAGALTLINSSIVASPVATVSFPGIPQTFNHLKVIGLVKSSVVTETDTMCMQLNADTGFDYDICCIGQAAGAVITTTTGGLTSWNTGQLDIVGAGTTGSLGSLDVLIPHYTDAANFKACQWESGYNDVNKSATDSANLQFIGTWEQKAAVTSMTLFVKNGNLAVGSAFWLYGIT